MNFRNLTLSILSLLFISLFTACNGTSVLVINPGSQSVTELRFSRGVNMVLQESTGMVWLGGGPGTAVSSGLVKITVDGGNTVNLRALDDGSFLYKFAGNENSQATVEWVNSNGVKQILNNSVSTTSSKLSENIAPAGLYPNRLDIQGDYAWVINSGDDSYTAYNLNTLQNSGMEIKTPDFSNPWEAAWIDDASGVITTLFGGAIYFNSVTGNTTEIDPAGSMGFASPNGVAVHGDYAYIANPNPLSYFPTVHGDGWISAVKLDGAPSVETIIVTGWLNPQNVISFGNYVYASCTGTVDFPPPDYLPTPLDNGGVHVIDPATKKIIASYPLGLSGSSPMAITPDGRYLYIGSNIAGYVYRIDLEEGKVLNDISNPIVVDENPFTFVPALEMTEDGLLIVASFNTDSVHFVNGWTGERNPFPFFEPLKLHEDDPFAFWGVQDIAVCTRNNGRGLLILTSVESKFHWVPI